MMMPHPLLPVGLPPASVAMAMNQMNHLNTIANMVASAQVHSPVSRPTSVIKVEDTQHVKKNRLVRLLALVLQGHEGFLKRNFPLFYLYFIIFLQLNKTLFSLSFQSFSSDEKNNNMMSELFGVTPFATYLSWSFCVCRCSHIYSILAGVFRGEPLFDTICGGNTSSETRTITSTNQFGSQQSRTLSHNLPSETRWAQSFKKTT